MTDSVYKFIELVGASSDSWEKAAAAAVEKASQTLRDCRVAEIKELDMQIENGKIAAYRAKVMVSFRVEKIEELSYHKDPASWFQEKEHTAFDG
jgi:hypothetical protein